MGKTKAVEKWDKENCPACGQEMNICREETGLYYCDRCHIHVKDGEVKNTDINGEFANLAHVKPLKLVDKKEEKPKPQNIDIFFASGDKKCFRGVIGAEPRGGWIMLTKADGKEIQICAGNINYLEEI